MTPDDIIAIVNEPVGEGTWVTWGMVAVFLIALYVLREEIL